MTVVLCGRKRTPGKFAAAEVVCVDPSVQSSKGESRGIDGRWITRLIGNWHYQSWLYTGGWGVVRVAAAEVKHGLVSRRIPARLAKFRRSNADTCRYLKMDNRADTSRSTSTSHLNFYSPYGRTTSATLQPRNWLVSHPTCQALVPLSSLIRIPCRRRRSIIGARAQANAGTISTAGTVSAFLLQPRATTVDGTRRNTRARHVLNYA